MTGQTDAIASISTARHSWMGEQRKSALDTPTHCEETWRGCAVCGLVKITVHPPHGLPYRVWRYPDGSRSNGAATPECRPA
jgi:hypothetical protein